MSNKNKKVRQKSVVSQKPDFYPTSTQLERFGEPFEVGNKVKCSLKKQTLLSVFIFLCHTFNHFCYLLTNLCWLQHFHIVSKRKNIAVQTIVIRNFYLCVQVSLLILFDWTIQFIIYSESSFFIKFQLDSYDLF